MNILRFALVAVVAAASTSPAFAHALLDHAVPAVGGSVRGSPAEIALSFSENVVASFSGIKLTAPDGAAVPTGKATVSPSSPATLRVSVGRALKPGTYAVNWHAVSVDTHRTTGSYKFTVAP